MKKNSYGCSDDVSTIKHKACHLLPAAEKLTRELNFYPALFQTTMIKAILESRKFKTRRILKEQDIRIHPVEGWPGSSTGEVKCPYGQPGDIIWIREKFFINKRPTGAPYWYYAGEDHDFTYPDNEKWKPSIHMPKDAARIFLQIKSIKVERLQDITDEDAIAEGIDQLYFTELKSYRYKDYLADPSGYGHPDHDFPTVPTARNSFQTLWMSIHGIDSWDLNPWVWVIEFKQVERPDNFITKKSN